MDKIYVDLPYNLKDEGKKIGARFDLDVKKWYIDDEDLLPQFEKVFIRVPFAYKEEVKESGGCWDVEKKGWWTPAFNKVLVDKFTKYI
jgi:hypothetical protein